MMINPRSKSNQTPIPTPALPSNMTTVISASVGSHTSVCCAAPPHTDQTSVTRAGLAGHTGTNGHHQTEAVLIQVQRPAVHLILVTGEIEHVLRKYRSSK